MKKRLTIFIAVLVIAIIAAGGWLFYRRSQATNTGSNAQSVTKASTSLQTKKDLSGDHDVLVVYFSRTEGVWNGPLKIGNTARVANFIQEATNADTYEIVPEKDYPTDYRETADQAQKEQEEDARPAIKGDLPDVTGYEYIFIGSPVWWSEYPMIVRTFLDAEAKDLQNKTLIPFTTHEGSGLGGTQEQLESQFPNATVLDGFSVRGTDAADAKSDVIDWLTKIGVTN